MTEIDPKRGLPPRRQNSAPPMNQTANGEHRVGAAVAPDRKPAPEL